MMFKMSQPTLWVTLILLFVNPLFANGTPEASPTSPASPDIPPVTRVVPQPLDTAGFNDVDYSADGTLVTGASISGTIKIWRTSDHLVIALFKGYEGLSQVSLSPDSRLVAFTTDSAVTVLDIASGQTVFRQPLEEPTSTWALSFGASSDVLVAASADAGNNLSFPQNFQAASEVRLRRYFPLSQKSTISTRFTAGVPTSFFSSRKRGTMGIGTEDGAVWGLKPENLSLSLLSRGPGRIQGLGQNSHGQWLVVAKNQLWRLDAKGQRERLGELEVHDSQEFRPPVCFPDSGDTGLLYGPDRTVKAFDLKTAEIVGAYPLRQEGDRSGLAIDPQGREFAVGQWDNLSGSPLYDLEGRNLDGRLGNPYWFLGGAQLNDGRFIFSGSGTLNEGRIFAMDVRGLGEGMRALAGHAPHAMKVLDRPGPPTLAFSNAGGYSLFKADRVAEESTFATVFDRSFFEWINTVSPDGRYVYFAREKGKQTELVQREIEGSTRGKDKVLGTLSGGPRKGDIAVSQDGRIVFFPLGSNFLVYDNKKGAVVLQKDSWPAGNFANTLSNDGQLLALEQSDRGPGTTVLQATTGAEVARIDMTLEPGELTLLRTFSPDGKYLAVSTPRRVFVYLTKTWKLDQTFTLNGGDRGACFFFSADGRYLVQGDSNGLVSFAHLGSGQVVKFLKTDSDWLFFTEDGYFEGSSNAGKMLALVKGTEAFGMDQVAVQYNRPDIIMERLGITQDNADLYAFFQANYRKRLLRMGLTQEQVHAQVSRPVTTVERLEAAGTKARLELSFSGPAVRRFSVYVNDVPLFGQNGKSVEDDAVRQTVEFPLVPGVNKIEASCFSEAGTESLRVLSKIDGPPVESFGAPELYYLGFGVSTYANSDLNLRYAHKDALDLEQAFLHQTPDSYVTVHTKTFVNNQVHLDTMRQAKAFLAQARPQDTVILFIAGHGIFTKDSETPDYYYIAYNTDVKDLEHTAIRFSEVEDLLQGLPSRQKLFLMDTCNSGEVDPLTYTEDAAASTGNAARAVRGLTVTKLASNQKSVPRTWLSQRDRYSQNDLIRRSGAIVFSSSKGGEYSYESDAIGNGMFTSAILGVLSGSVDATRSGDGLLTVRDLVKAVSAAVPKMTQDMQHPGVDRDNLSVNFALPLSDPSNVRRPLTLGVRGLPDPAGSVVHLKVGKADGRESSRFARRVTGTVGAGGQLTLELDWWISQGLTLQVVNQDGSPRPLTHGLGNDQERGVVLDSVTDAKTLPGDRDSLEIDLAPIYATARFNGTMVIDPAFDVTLEIRGLADAAGQSLAVTGAQGPEKVWETPVIELDSSGTGTTRLRLATDQEALTLRSNFVEFATFSMTAAHRARLKQTQSNTVIWDQTEPAVLVINGTKMKL